MLEQWFETTFHLTRGPSTETPIAHNGSEYQEHYIRNQISREMVVEKMRVILESAFHTHGVRTGDVPSMVYWRIPVDIERAEDSGLWRGYARLAFGGVTPKEAWT